MKQAPSASFVYVDVAVAAAAAVRVKQLGKQRVLLLHASRHSDFFSFLSLSLPFYAAKQHKRTESIKYPRVVLLFVPLFFLFTALYSCQSVTTYCFKALRKVFPRTTNVSVFLYA